MGMDLPEAPARLTLLCFALGATACGSSRSREPEPPPLPPAAELTWSLRPGPVLGPTEPSPPETGTPHSALRLGLAWLPSPLEPPPGPAPGQPLDATARLILRPGTADPWAALSQRASRVRHIPNATESTAEGALELAIPVGTTAGVRVESPTHDPDVELRLGARSGGGFDLVCVLGPDDDLPEALLLQDSFEPGSGATAFDLPTDGSPAGTWRLSVQALELDALGDPELLRQDSADRLVAFAGDAEPSSEAVPTSGRAARMANAVDAAAQPGTRRTALIYLTESCNASLAGDLALVVEDAELARLVEDWRAQLGDARDEATIGLSLERAAAHFVADALESDAPPAELRSLLAVHAGDLARSPGTVAAIADAASDLEQRNRVLVDENLSALTDADPFVRVTAFEWLARRDEAPESFDPLADRTVRRIALERFAEARADVAVEEAAPTADPKE